MGFDVELMVEDFSNDAKGLLPRPSGTGPPRKRTAAQAGLRPLSGGAFSLPLTILRDPESMQALKSH
jgi:hypothetical protein